MYIGLQVSTYPVQHLLTSTVRVIFRWISFYLFNNGGAKHRLLRIKGKDYKMSLNKTKTLQLGDDHKNG